MTRYTLPAILLATTFATPVLAADPKACADDPRMQCIDYKPNDIVRVYLAAGATFRIQLAPGEEVDGLVVSDQRTIGREDEEPPSAQEIAAGAQGGKQVATCDPNMCRSVVGNFVYVMPRRDLAAQPFFLQGRWTDVSGKAHSTPYAFELQTRPPQLGAGQKLASNRQTATDAQPLAQTFYGVRFTYSERDAEERKRAAAARAAAWRAAHPPQPYVPPPTPSVPQLSANWQYAYRGAPEVKPDEVWDDGRTTFLRFNGNRRIPNVYAFLPDGTETNGFGYTSEPDATGTIIRIGKTDRRWCVRDGDKTGCLYNAGGDPEGRTVPTVAPQTVPITPIPAPRTTRSAAR
jgi:type IV secretion system protein VirB9